MRTLILLLLSISALTLRAQDIDIPRDVKYEGEADYRAQEDNFVKVTDWILTTPLNKMPYQHRAANKFLLLWMQGTPTITVEVSDKLVPFEDCEPCLIVFMSAFSRHLIKHPAASQEEGNYQAVKDMIAFYQKNKGAIGKVSMLEKFSKLEGKGKLKQRIQSL